ncbi:hypothetical protein Dimus_023564 [Dionaea muscipula]
MTTKLQRCRRITHLLSPKSLTASIRRSLHEGPNTVEELLDRHLVKEKKPSDDDEEELLTRRRRLTNTHRESLSLYRDILWVTCFFTWANMRGVLWRDILRANARKEFEEAQFEKDPEVVTRLLIGGRDTVQQALDKLVEKQKQLVEQERSSNRRGY